MAIETKVSGVQLQFTYNGLRDFILENGTKYERQFICDCGRKAEHNLSDKQQAYRKSLYEKYRPTYESMSLHGEILL